MIRKTSYLCEMCRKYFDEPNIVKENHCEYNVCPYCISNLKGIKPNKTYGGIYYADGIYNFTVCEHRDGSGKKADLSRYYGNENLLKVIIEELEVQLFTYELWYGVL